MDSRNPSLILQDSPAPCLTTSQGTQDATLTSQDTPANYTVFTPTEPSPAPWDSNGVVRRAQEWGGDTPTGAANVEGVHVTPPTSLTGSSKSRVSLVSMCRICHEGEATGALMRPCRCSGTMAFVHRVCLERWLNLATSDKCELCGHRYSLRFISRPFWQFLIKCDNEEARRALKVDLLCLLVLTPMAVLSVYLCSAGALQYLRENQMSFAIFNNDPNKLHANRSGRLQEQMAHRRSAQFMREMLTKPWNTVGVFQQDNILARVPEHYKKFFWEWKCVEPRPVHYVPTPGKFEQMPNGEILPVQNIALPLKKPMQLHQGIWGGEAVIKGFQKRKPHRRRVTHYWVPAVKKSVVYSEILDRHMTLTVTERALRLIDEHYGFDNYILETPPADLMSRLALRIRREMLLALVRETLYPDNPAKKEEVLQKYKKHIIPEEEADWYGLNLMEASNKQKLLEEIANQPQPLKYQFRAEFVEYLKTVKDQEQEAAAEEKQSLSASSWLSKVNPFAKKDE